MKSNVNFEEDYNASNFTDKMLSQMDKDYITSTVYDRLPSLLKDSCNVFNDQRERDVYLTGALAALGGCFHNVVAYNLVDKKGVAPNLMAFVIAPPASGKRSLEYAKKLIDKVKKIFSEKDKRKLIIPANISSSGLLQLLQENEGVGVMIESEIDTLLNAQKQEWGKNNDIIRNCFDNESYLMYRKKEKEYIEIDKPKLSMALSGTENQFKELMGSVENGLFSRGCYYNFDDFNPILKSFGRINSDTDIEEKIASFANIVSDYYSKVTLLKNVKICFSERQLTLIQALQQDIYESYLDKEDFHANIKRMFLIILKISTIIETLFRCEENSIIEEAPCSDLSLELGTLLAFTFLIHAISTLSILPKIKTKVGFNNYDRIYSLLPNEFTKADVITNAIELGICQKSGYNAFSYFIKSEWISLQPNGKYGKSK